MLQKWDELNSLRTATIEKLKTEYRKTGKLNRDRCIDLVLDLLISAYVFGADDVDAEVKIDSEAMRKAIYKEIAGETFADRIAKYVEEINAEEAPSTSPNAPAEAPSPSEVPASETVPEQTPVPDSEHPIWPIIVVADTESHRDYGEGELAAAKQSGKSWKTWVTMRDDRVRDTHSYLDSTTVAIDELFFTFDGDSARFPGDFGKPQNNVGCRCVLLFT